MARLRKHGTESLRILKEPAADEQLGYLMLNSEMNLNL